MIDIDLGLNWLASMVDKSNDNVIINTIWSYVIIRNQDFSTSLFYGYFGIFILITFIAIMVYTILLILEDSIRDFFDN